MIVRRSCAGIAAVAVLLGVAACGDDDDSEVSDRGGPGSALEKDFSGTNQQPQSSGSAASREGAIERFETFLHALGEDDRVTICEIAGPAAASAEAQGFGDCHQTYGIVAEMISSEQAGALQQATVDPTLVEERSPTEVHVPVEAVQSSVQFTEDDLGSYTLRFQDGNWFIIDD